MTKETAKNALFFFLDRFGLPTLIIVVGGWWMAGHVADPLVRSHVGFLDQQVQISRCQSETLESLTKVVSAMQASSETPIVLLKEIMAHQRGQIEKK